LEELMPKKKVVLVTGASSEWGKRVASLLISLPGMHVIGLDKEKPEEDIRGLDFIQADIRNNLIGDLLNSEKVESICHLAFIETRQPSEDAFDFNVMGTIKLLATCSNAGVKKVVLKSSMAVYGAQSTNSAFLTETHALKGDRSVGELRDLIEIEAFCNGFQRQAPGLNLTVLRFPNILGPTVNTSMVRYLKEPLVPVLMGFDPRMQIIHENDVIGALVYALLHDVPGAFNVAAEGVLPLLRLIAMAGKIPLPVFHLFAYWGKAAFGGIGNRAFDSIPYDLDSLRYDCVGDLAKMRDVFGYSPQYTAVETLREFASYLRISTYKTDPDDLKRDEDRLRDTLERRARVKQSEHRERHAHPTFDQDAALSEVRHEDEGAEGV
jgi:UDP-glucose 4-epimerase